MQLIHPARCSHNKGAKDTIINAKGFDTSKEDYSKDSHNIKKKVFPRIYLQTCIETVGSNSGQKRTYFLQLKQQPNRRDSQHYFT
jgi:hypothetical protein